MIAAARPGRKGTAGAWSTTYALPFAPLAAVRPETWRENVDGVWGTRNAGGLNVVLTPTQQRAWHRAQRQGWVSFAIADDLALTLGYHPSEIWGLLWA